MSRYPSIPDVCFDALGKVVSASFLHCKVIVLFVYTMVIPNLGGRYVETIEIAICSSTFHPIVWHSFHIWFIFLGKLILRC